MTGGPLSSLPGVLPLHARELSPLLQVLKAWKSGLALVEAADLGSLLRRLRRTPAGLALLPVSRLDELPGLAPTGLRLVLEARDLSLFPGATPGRRAEAAAGAESVDELDRCAGDPVADLLPGGGGAAGVGTPLHRRCCITPQV